ncbi:hypothetical protein TRVA0_017S02058 [Trichomonascus vanleenenianus]|uniref:uncharacterized protein n=1 Tax=Trichomonascus vanleenenianus TaxID=2268995 RepID=UPI003ECA9B75
MPQHEYLKSLPREIWELVFDHLGLNLDSLHLTCRFFRDIAARKRWSNVNIRNSDFTSAPCTLLITGYNMKEAFEIMSVATKYLNKLTLAPERALYFNYEDSDVVKVSRLAMNNASEVTLKIDSKTFTWDSVGIEMIDDFKHLGSEKKQIAKLLGCILYQEEALEELTETIHLLETFTTSIEIELHVFELQSFADNHQLMRYVKSLSVHMSGRFPPQGEVDELLQRCPRIEYLATGFSTPGCLVLPERILAFESYGCSTVEMVTVSSKFVTRFRVPAEVFKMANTFDFPNLQTLELLYFTRANVPIPCDHLLGALQQLTKNLTRLVIENAESCMLNQIAPLANSITEEIRIMKVDDYEPTKLNDYRQYLRGLFDFMACSLKARTVRLQIPLMEPQSMKAVIKAIVQRCPHLESLSTTDKYPHRRMDVLCPYMHKVPFDPTLDYSLDYSSRVRTYEVDVQCIRGFRVPGCSDINVLLESMDLRPYQ